MSVNLSETICQATEIIAENLIRQISFDKTISCKIIDDSQKDKGKYLVESESAQFYAYASGSQKYSKGNNVYVSIPQGNWDEQKFIVGKKTSDNEAPVNYVDPYDSYIAITENMFDFDGNSTDPKGLIANGPIASVAVGCVKMDGIVGYTRMAIKAEFMCWLKELQVVRGNYGLKFIFDIKYGSDKKSAVLERYFDCSDMVGNPYQFESFFPQKKVFDISSVENIESIKIELFQDIDSFTDAKGNSGIYGGMQPFKNIFAKDIYVSFGYGAEEFDKDKLILLSSESESSETTDEKKDYDLSVRWIHKFEDGIRAVDFTKDKLPCALKYYEYTPGSASADQYSGVDWKNIKEYTNIPFESKNNIELKKDEWVTEGKEINYQSIKETPPIYKLHSISLGEYKDEEATVADAAKAAFDGADFAIEIDKEDPAKIIITCKGKVPEIDLKVNIEYQADEIKNKSFEDMTCSISIDTKRPENKYKAILVSEGIDPVYSNIIAYANDNADGVSEETIIAMRALQIYCDDDSYGNYLLYDLGGRILDTGAIRQVRDFKLYFSDSLDEVPSELNVWGEDLEKITWTIPAKNTMIKLVNTNGWTLYDNEGNPITNPEASNAYYYKQVFGKDGNQANDFVPTVQYTIGSYYNQTYNNNIVECQIVKNGITYVASKELTFGTMGTSGTDYTFVLDFKDNNYNALSLENTFRFSLDLAVEGWENSQEDSTKYIQTIIPDFGTNYDITSCVMEPIEDGSKIEYGMAYDKEKGSFTFAASSKPESAITIFIKAIINQDYKVIVQARLYDSLGKEIDINGKTISWEIQNNENIVAIPITGTPNEAELKFVEGKQPSSVPDNNYTILKASLPKNNDKDEGWGDYALDAYLPIPIRSGTHIKYISGATVIQYNALGQLNQYFQNPYALHIQNGNNIETNLGDWEITSGDEAGALYLPRLEVNDDKQTRIRPLGTYIQETNSMLCVYGQRQGEDEILWSQPLYVYQNRYPTSIVNKWNGQLVVDDEKNYIASAQVIAGKKEDDNSFTGIMMGAIGDVPEDESADSVLTDGIFGYKQGESAFAFKADGTAFIGLPGRGRLMFNGEASTIESASFQEQSKGMQLDFDRGKIEMAGIIAIEIPIELKANQWSEEKKQTFDSTYNRWIQKIHAKLDPPEIEYFEIAEVGKPMEEAYVNAGIAIGYEEKNGNRSIVFTCGEGKEKPSIDISLILKYNWDKDENGKQKLSGSIVLDAEEFKTPFKIGDASNPPFSVDWDGSFKSTAGLIGGWTIEKDRLHNNIVGMSPGVLSGGENYAFWAGSSEPNSASFRVTTGGKLYATGGDFSGKITATEGKIGDISIGNGGIYNDYFTLNSGGLVTSKAELKNALDLYGKFNVYDYDTEQLRGYMGAGSGSDGQGNTTYGVKIVGSSSQYYVIVTDSGIRLQGPGAEIVLSSNNIDFKVTDPKYDGVAGLAYDAGKWQFKHYDMASYEPIGSGSSTAVFG